jgi:catechol 2,3-dioxygenase-like lactoylglutathione lyase family enzyme
MRIERLSYLTLWAVRFDETKKLYREILGMPVVEENPNFVMFNTKSSRLAFHKLAKGPKLDRLTVELHLEVNDVDEVYNSLQRKGVKFDEKPANMPWGTRIASFRDPEGYQVEIVGPLKEGESSREVLSGSSRRASSISHK